MCNVPNTYVSLMFTLKTFYQISAYIGMIAVKLAKVLKIYPLDCI